MYHELPAWIREDLEAAFYLQSAGLGQGCYNTDPLCPVGQDLGGFQHKERSGFAACFEDKRIPSTETVIPEDAPSGLSRVVSVIESWPSGVSIFT
ncbi:MAG: hypothetical protein LBG43_08680 [Treponema sp.]|jgi:hypothetical protein|nr:hypothetical protein [Treponema sp.]